MRGYQVLVPLYEPGVPLELTRAMLGIGLRALVAQNLAWLIVHPNTPKLYDSGVVYEREPPGQEEWQTIPSVIDQGSGDCEDLAAWRVAELQRAGEPARIITKSARQLSGKLLIHVLVRRGDGTLEDPSMLLGMGIFA